MVWDTQKEPISLDLKSSRLIHLKCRLFSADEKSTMKSHVFDPVITQKVPFSVQKLDREYPHFNALPTRSFGFFSSHSWKSWVWSNDYPKMYLLCSEMLKGIPSFQCLQKFGFRELNLMRNQSWKVMRLIQLLPKKCPSLFRNFTRNIFSFCM